MEMGLYLTSSPLIYESGWAHPIAPSCDFHAHPSHELIVHSRGAGRTRIEDGIEFDHAEGSVLILSPNVHHAQTNSTPALDMCVQFSTSGGRPLLSTKYRALPRLVESVLYEEVSEFCRAVTSRSPVEQRILNHRLSVVVSVLLEMAETVSREVPPNPGASYAHEANQCIRQEFGKIRNVADLAARIGVSFEYLRHAFKQTYGMSIKRAVIRARMTHAKRLLERSQLPLKVIADACGYDNERYFCTAFRKSEGRTPGEYRKAAVRVPAGDRVR